METLERYAQKYETPAEHLRRWLIEAMVIGAAADGQVDRRESDEIVRIIVERPEFATLQEGELRSILDHALESVLAEGFTPRMHALAGALPRYAHRVLAFRSAVSVALADGELADDELSFLREFQKVLGIVESDVARAFEVSSSAHGGVAAEDIEPVEAYLDVLLMAAAADGVVQGEELATLLAFVLSRDEFDGVSEEHMRAYIDERIEEYTTRPIEDAIERLALELALPEQRINAYGLAESMVAADGEIFAAEHHFLEVLALGLNLEAAREEIATPHE